MSEKTTGWKAAVWDRPSNGTRYSVERRNPAAEGGVDIAETPGGRYVLTFPSREKARAYAVQLNEAGL